ncbi:hypothetical protein PR003_g18411 [Phytophthora rubi]|uniref:Uncharacterized protein n=1 Tax=Phytophthora rubi TaxID=129364 RepID=A0A6A3K341_9STRA|nr:hypothetical protein PR002_g17785 [Phytophthora rubi]KAE9005232.1 hypothetical protein PR001_g17506 [Phytophthora rubi]KAE9317724.1 hypothetical protein PR003_g18411 [Phytophthora rubi]
MTTRHALAPYAKSRQKLKQKHRPAPFEEAPPSNLKLMNNSERGKYYRQRRKLNGAHMERCVVALREEIAALIVTRQVQRELALSQQRTPLGAAAHIVSEYCSMFSHGTPVRLAVNEQNATVSLVASVVSILTKPRLRTEQLWIYKTNSSAHSCGTRSFKGLA